jgi:hypothetical protein
MIKYIKNLYRFAILTTESPLWCTSNNHMNIRENVDEGLRSIQSNLLRTVLTAMIIAIGITSLVGILTAIEGIQNSVTAALLTLGPIHLPSKTTSTTTGVMMAAKTNNTRPSTTARH